MSTDGPKKGYALVIDTNSYAGNFERELTAHCTGQVGECGVGEEMAEKLPIEFDNVLHVADEHGCSRPCSIWQRPDKKSYDSVAIFFDDRPSQEQIDFIKQRAATFNEAFAEKSDMAEFHTEKVGILGFRLVKIERKSTEETL